MGLRGRLCSGDKSGCEGFAGLRAKKLAVDGRRFIRTGGDENRAETYGPGGGALRKERCGFVREKAWAPAAKSGVRLSLVDKEQILQRMMRFKGWAACANMGDRRARLSRKRNT
jgi:hypothetical protein